MGKVPNYKGKVKNIMTSLNELRLTQDVSLMQYLAKEYKSNPRELYNSLKIPDEITVSQFLTLDDDTRWLFPEVVRDAIRYGLAKAPFTNDITANRVRTQGTSYEMPWFNFSKLESTENQTYTPGATIDEDKIETGTKRVGTKKRGKAIKLPYETLRDASVKLLPLYFMGVGRRIMNDINAKAVDTLLNGDGAQDDSQNQVDQSPAVIGVQDTGVGIQEDDLIDVMMKMAEAGKTPTTLIGPFAQMKKIEKFSIFSTKVYGSEKIRLKTKTPLPNTLDRFISKKVPAGKLIILNKHITLIELVRQALSVEADKIIQKQLHLAVASIESGFGIVDRGGRLVLDGNQTYDESQYPVWLEY